MNFGGTDYIEELVIGGAKSYSYKTKYGCTKKDKVQVKQKGITLDMANDEVVNVDTMRDMVSSDSTIKSKNDFNSNGTPKQKTLSPNTYPEASNQQSKRNEQ